jgi:hypothetical protein
LTQWEITGQQSDAGVVGLMSMLAPGLAAQRGAVYIDRMPIYTISVRADRSGFDVEVIGGDGRCQIRRGFKTMADVRACIAQNKLLADAVYLGEPSSFRTLWRC